MVCDLQARAVKNFEAASKRQAVGLAKEGITTPDGGDPSDEELGDFDREGVELGQPPIHKKDAASAPPASTVATTPAASTDTATPVRTAITTRAARTTTSTRAASVAATTLRPTPTAREKKNLEFRG